MILYPQKTTEILLSNIDESNLVQRTQTVRTNRTEVWFWKVWAFGFNGEFSRTMKETDQLTLGRVEFTVDSIPVVATIYSALGRLYSIDFSIDMRNHLLAQSVTIGKVSTEI